ncbi:acetate--CoA ligase family protein [Verticiella sediminum]|uniref:Acetate--CoA ligase family protein n=1 Tax=Verticiella sediminum TaxID=1247510 RepID=A0A556AY32_9BURK|nr:acetate--CoA ligase family protein [Verticiella sediminum]TSH97375.1 acetate--CoA ligase family protein [Verticiella sediminum]
MSLLRHLFSPRSVAIIGASSDPRKIGGRPIRFMKAYGYAGRILPINANAAEIQGLPAYARVEDVVGEVDQALIVVPAAAAEDALRGCVAKGVKVVQVLSSGFGEAGDEGRILQDRLVRIAREAGMRMTGPNALGVVSPGERYFGTFSTALEGMCPEPGGVAMVTQSGAFGSCAYVMAMRRGLGLSRVIATGNEADVDVSELIGLLADDAQTRVICAAVEACKDGERLRAALRKAAARNKPVIVMKVGTTEVGAAAAATHTGSLAGNDAVYDAVFRECGAYRARSIEEMIDVAYACSLGGMPGNDRVGIVTVSGGIGILMADAASEAGLALPAPSASALHAMREVLPFVTGANPLDVTAQIAVNRAAITAIGQTMVDDADYGALLIYLANNALAPPVFETTKQAVLALRHARPDVLLVTVMPAEDGVRMALEEAGVLVFEDPSRAVRSVAAAAELRRLQQDASEAVPAARPGAALPAGEFDEAGAKALLAQAGVPVLDERVVHTAEDAAAHAERLGGAVVLKIVSPEILHKTEVGGVALGLQGGQAVRQGFETILQRVRTAAPQARIDGVLVAPMAGPGVETIVGVHVDPVFGAVMMFGLGGIFVELFRDVAFASAPLSPARARRLIRATRGSALLDGWRGAAPVDVQALVDVLCRLSAFAATHAHELASIEINPLLVRESGCVALDAVITMRNPSERAPV